MQTSKNVDSVGFQLVAGHPALDLVNTLDWRFRPSGSEELLNSCEDLLRFTEQSGLMMHEEVQEFATSTPLKKRRSLSATKELRESLALICYAIADGQAPPIESVGVLSVFARAVRRSENLQWCDGRLQWRPDVDRGSASDSPFRRLILSALDVEAQEVVPIEPCSADRRVEVEASMGTVEVVVMEPEVELDLALC